MYYVTTTSTHQNVKISCFQLYADLLILVLKQKDRFPIIKALCYERSQTCEFFLTQNKTKRS